MSARVTLLLQHLSLFTTGEVWIEQMSAPVVIALWFQSRHDGSDLSTMAG
jgi:hypothetical protein